MELRYEPSDWQKRFHALTVNEALGAGAAGPGKTMALRFDPIVTQAVIEHARCARDPRLVTNDPSSTLWQLVEEHPLDWGASSGHSLYLRRSRPRYAQERDRAIKVFKAMDPGGYFDKSEDTFVFSSGFKYQWGHCHGRTDYQQFDSNEYTGIYFDELIQFEQEQYERIKIRCRTSDPVLIHFLRIRAASNPQQAHEAGDNYVLTNPHWVRDYFVKPAPEGKVILETTVTLDDGSEEVWRRIFLPAFLKDNPDPAFRRRYELDLQKTLPHIRRAMLRGDWFFRADAIFAEVWNRDEHVVTPFGVPSHWGMFRSMDWGYKTPGCVHWHAVNPETDDIYTVAEYTFKGRTAKSVAQEIIRKETRWGLAYQGKSLITGPADTQLWEDRGDTGRTKAQEMSRLGVRWEKANKRSRKRNAEHVGMRLQSKDDQGREGGGWYIFKGCTNLHQTLPMIPAEADDPAVPKKGGDDHWYDSGSYALSYASNHKIRPVKRVHDAPRAQQKQPKKGWVTTSGYWT